MGKRIKSIIMGVGNFLKKQIALLSLAMSNVEKDTFGQKGSQVEQLIGQERRHSQGTLMDSLVHGVMTEEVMNLRWRMYKTAAEAEKIKTTIYYLKDKNGKYITDDEGNLIVDRVEKKTLDSSKALELIKIDEPQRGPLELVMNNDPITLSVENVLKVDSGEIIKNLDENGEIISATHGKVDATNHSNDRQELPIKIYRETLPKFEIETYTKKLNIISISDTEKLLEFYVSMYPDEYNRTTRLFISDVKKAIENPRAANMLDIKEVGFITRKAIGVSDNYEYQYTIKSFDSITTFNGHYIIKFLAEPLVNGKYILEEFRMEELDEKYKKKEKRKKPDEK